MSTYISNGTMGELWMEENCERCAKDHSFGHVDVNDADNGCPVVALLMCHEYPIEGLIEHEGRGWPSELQCTYFKPCNEGECETPADYRPSSWQPVPAPSRADERSEEGVDD